MRETIDDLKLALAEIERLALERDALCKQILNLERDVEVVRENLDVVRRERDEAVARLGKPGKVPTS